MKKTFKDIKTYTLEENISDNEILYSVIISNYKWKNLSIKNTSISSIPHPRNPGSFSL